MNKDEETLRSVSKEIKEHLLTKYKNFDGKKLNNKSFVAFFDNMNLETQRFLDDKIEHYKQKGEDKIAAMLLAQKSLVQEFHQGLIKNYEKKEK